MVRKQSWEVTKSMIIQICDFLKLLKRYIRKVHNYEIAKHKGKKEEGNNQNIKY